MSHLLKYYFSLADWLMKDGLSKKKYLPWQSHSQLIIVLSTGVLMWCYAFLAYYTISDPTPAYVGFIASSVHLLSPLALRYGQCIHLASHLLIGAGLVHQGCFAYYSGGFNSNIMIWYGILPMLGGVILGRIGVVIWLLLTTSISAFALYKTIYLTPFPMLITDEGWLIAQGLMVFGWIFLSSSIIYAFTVLMERNNEEVAQNASKIRTLVRVLCHDISNPLTTVKNRLIHLSKLSDDEVVIKHLEKASRPLQTIQEIIDQVRNWEALESGKASLNFEPIAVDEAINNAIDLFSEVLIKKNLTLKVSMPEDRTYIYADKSSLQTQIISNIISNAIKFSEPRNTIMISLFTENENAIVKISDNGIGIPLKILDHLFDPAIKTNRAGTQGEKGTGFGMPIVKFYVEKFGGKVDVTSQTSEESTKTGTTFELSFPLYRPKPQIEPIPLATEGT